MKIKPLQERVLIKRLDAESKTASGIIVTSNNSDRTQEALVVAVGKDADVKVGDKVLTYKGVGIPISADGEEYFLLGNNELLAKVN